MFFQFLFPFIYSINDYIKVYEREAMMDSIFYWYYMNVRNYKTDLFGEIVRNIIKHSRNSQHTDIHYDSCKYVMQVTGSAVDIMNDMKNDIMMEIILNTKSELVKIGEVSPFNYVMIHHIHRIYNYCQEFQRMYVLYKNLHTINGTDEILREVINEVITLNDNRVKFDDHEMILEFINFVANKRNLFQKDFFNELLRLELRMIIIDMDHVKHCRKNMAFKDIFIRENKLYTHIIPKEPGDHQYILMRGGDICSTLVSRNVTDFYGECNIDPYFMEFGKEPSDRKFCKGKNMKLDEFIYLLKENIEFVKETFEVLLYLVLFYDDLYATNTLLKVSLEELEILQVSIEWFGTDINVLLDYYKKYHDHTADMKIELANKIKENRNCEFMEITSLQRYSFNKPHTNAKPVGYRCLCLECGHYLGHDLIEEYLRTGEYKCFQCNLPRKIAKYFEAEYYEVED